MQSLNLNLIPDGTIAVAYVSQYDVGRQISFTVYNGTSEYSIPSGTTIQVNGRKADQTVFIYNQSLGYVSYRGSTITLTTNLQMTAAAGDCETQFRLFYNNTEIGILNFIMKVQIMPGADDQAASCSDLPAIITQATAQMERAEAAADAAEESLGKIGTAVNKSEAAATKAANSATAANSSKTAAASSATSAASSATAAASSASSAAASADEAESWSSNPPYIGSNGNWWVYNITSGRFVDSGVDASITVTIADITMLDPDESPYVTNTGTGTIPIFHLFIPRGKGISKIEKKSTAGLVDTYQITYSDGSTYTYNVTNGKTAYLYAQDGGYTGTESEFATDMADLKEYKDDAADSATSASSSKSAAATSATSAATSASTAQKWAVGTSGSGTDTPSDTNNAYYWSKVAASKAGNAYTPLIVPSLPTTNISTSTLYIIPADDVRDLNNYDKYVNTDGTTDGWEHLNPTMADSANLLGLTVQDGLLCAVYEE